LSGIEDGSLAGIVREGRRSRNASIDKADVRMIASHRSATFETGSHNFLMPHCGTTGG
jgi:hypothetical protein